MTVLPIDSFHPQDLGDWRSWLAAHHDSSPGVWLVGYKKSAGRPGLGYEEAVCEALCWGWIDSVVRGLDGERTLFRYTPRRRGSGWSSSNKRRLEPLAREGRIQPAGQKAISAARADGSWFKLEVAASRRAQGAAKAVLDQLGSRIGPSSSEASVAEDCVQLLAAQGVTQTWYHDCPALVLAGSRSCDSVSGREYRPSVEPFGDRTLITVDLSPVLAGAWGDCARSFPLVDGRVDPVPADPEFRDGVDALAELHRRMGAFARPETRFDELWTWAEEQVTGLGFENLDFHGNFGHSIVSDLDDRVFIEAQNSRTLGEVGLFTFEPHLRRNGGSWGFKHEEIYGFDAKHRPKAL